MACIKPILPIPVRQLAERLGVVANTEARSVTLTQVGDMRLGKSKRRTRFRARQIIDLRKPGFKWIAHMGPFGALRVTDAYQDGEGQLDVRLFGLLPVTRMRGAEVAKGEIMRYLAELALAPDLILLDRALEWTIISEHLLEVAAGIGAGRGMVRIELDKTGRVGAIYAQDRPFADGKIVEERPWSGRFSDYRLHEGRWLPFAAEVGWVIDGVTRNYWRGTMTSWRVA